MLAEPFPSFTFSPAGASVYQLGSFGTARKELKALTLSPFDSREQTQTIAATALTANVYERSLLTRSPLPDEWPLFADTVEKAVKYCPYDGEARRVLEKRWKG